MSASLDVLFLRRPRIDYVSPPICENVFTGSGSPVIVLEAFGGLDKITGVVIDGDFPNRIVRWPEYPGAICYTIYEVGDDGELIIIAECVEGPEYPLPPDVDGPIVVTPITPDGEGDPSDPVTPPPDGGGGGGCEEFCDETNISGIGFIFNIAKDIGLVAGSNPANSRPWVYHNRADSDVRSTRSSGTIQASQAASDLVNTDGEDFFLPGDVGKFLQFDSGGDAREILAVNGPTQAQVDVSDTVALSTFKVYGTTVGGPFGSADLAGNGNHVAGSEAMPDLSGTQMFWCDLTTGTLRALGNGINYLATRLNTAGHLLYTFNDGSSIQSFIYNPNTETSSQVGAGAGAFSIIGIDMNDSNVVVGRAHIVNGGPGEIDDQRGFRWSGGVTTFIDPADAMPLTEGRDVWPMFVNNSGLVIGVYEQDQFAGPSFGSRRRTFWNNGGASQSIGHFFVGLAAEGEVDPSDLSNSGIAVGSADIDGTHFCAWKWTIAGGLVQLANLPGHNTGFAESVNDEGYIVGASKVEGVDPNYTPCIWLPGEVTPHRLFDFTPTAAAEGWTQFIAVHAITNDNEVVGIGAKGVDVDTFFLKLCFD
jgi:hypothetical protein